VLEKATRGEIITSQRVAVRNFSGPAQSVHAFQRLRIGLV